MDMRWGLRMHLKRLAHLHLLDQEPHEIVARLNLRLVDERLLQPAQ
jgi:hypothetical protein